MQVPAKILVDFPSDKAPAGYFNPSQMDDSDDEDDVRHRIHFEPATKLMTPPKTLTATDIGEEERRRYMRDTSFNNINYPVDDSIYKTPTDTSLKNTQSDPSGMARQVRHLHNRVKLLEDELLIQHNRQVVLIGVVSIFILTHCVKFLYR